MDGSRESLSAGAVAVDRWARARRGAPPAIDLGSDNGTDTDNDHDNDDHGTDSRSDVRPNSVAYYLRPVWFGNLVCVAFGVGISHTLLGAAFFWGVVLAYVGRWLRARGYLARGRYARGAARPGPARAAVRDPHVVRGAEVTR